LTENVIKNKVAAYLLLNAEEKALKEMKERLKAELEPYLQQAEENSKGSKVIAFSEPLEVAGARYKSLQKVRKESRVLNEERALEYLLKDQAFEAAIVTVHHVDQDALWEYFVEGLISQEVLDSFFDTTITWAFSPTKE
jgi:hypothetical protein